MVAKPVTKAVAAPVKKTAVPAAKEEPKKKVAPVAAATEVKGKKKAEEK